uniref:C-type lectin domain-containing protein n=1 Tax=Myripristis murdjan TaxID=586833 RepID=A0A668A6A1_9TELE
MEKMIFVMLFITSVSWVIGKHVFVPQRKNWTDAQSYCREHYTDLSPINSERDTDRLRKASAGQRFEGWIGLNREPKNVTGWKWSGGGYVTYQNWAPGEPNNNQNMEYTVITMKGTWYDSKPYGANFFFCFNLIVVKEKKTWEDALEHCREDDTELTSLISETDLLLAQREIWKAQTTDHVWIGLRYLADSWLWVNGDPLEYEAWPQQGDQDQRCPNWGHTCGALTKEGLWRSRDCREKLHFICV